MKVNMKGLTKTIGKAVKSKTFKEFIIMEIFILFKLDHNGFVWDEETSSAKFYKYHPEV